MIENKTKYFLDGNNMLFVVNCLRKMCLSKKRMEAEEALFTLAKLFKESKQDLEMCVIYDRTKLEKIEQEGLKLYSAQKEKGQSTDDWFVDIAKDYDDDCTVFVTSDRELIQRLQQYKIKVESPKNWFKSVSEIIGEGDYEDNIQQYLNTN